MQCPHCLKEVYFLPVKDEHLGDDSSGHFKIYVTKCPACYLLIIKLLVGKIASSYSREYIEGTVFEVMVHPSIKGRVPIGEGVPNDLLSDYDEACKVLHLSPKASAALSRRCLQAIIREHLSITERTLFEEIEKASQLPSLPSDMSGDLHTLREMGNSAAHPMKNPNTGVIINIVPEEAEYMLEIIEHLFDHLFIAPKKRADRRKGFKAKKNGK